MIPGIFAGGMGVGGGGGGSTVTWNPADSDSLLNFSSGNLVVEMDGTSGVQYRSVRATASHSASDAYYFEVVAAYTRTTQFHIGIAKAGAALTNYIGADASGWAYQQNSGNKVTNAVSSTYGSVYWDGDVIGVAVKNGKVWFSLNGVWNGDPVAETGEAFSGITGDVFPAVTLFRSFEALVGRFKAADFGYTPPSGFSPWGT